METNTEDNTQILDEHRAIIDYNVEALDLITQGKANRPKLTRVLKRIYPYLYRLHEYARDRLIEKHDEYLPYEDKSGQFFVSCRYLERQYQGSYNTWNRNINVFATLGLIEKIPASEREIVMKDKDGIDYENPVNIYVFPQYTDEQLDYAESVAYRLVESNFRLNGFSKISLIKVFGQDFADEIFQDERKVTAYSDYVANQIEKFILGDIEQHGFSTKRRVIDGTKIDLAHVKNNEYGFHRGSRQSIIRREFDRSLHDICSRNHLKYKVADKRLVKQLKLDGYIWVIHPVQHNKKPAQ